jgi:hypothetical protein
MINRLSVSQIKCPTSVLKVTRTTKLFRGKERRLTEKWKKLWDFCQKEKVE